MLTSYPLFIAVFVSDSSEDKFSCPAVKPLTKVTLKGGLKAGDFTDTGKVGSIKECYATCCQQSSCNLAFMLGQNCFAVKCYNKDLCSTIPAQPSIFNPQIAYVWTRKEIKSGKYILLVLVRGYTTEPHNVCQLLKWTTRMPCKSTKIWQKKKRQFLLLHWRVRGKLRGRGGGAAVPATVIYRHGRKSFFKEK